MPVPPRSTRLRLERLEDRTVLDSTGSTGGGLPILNSQPSLALTYMISLQGQTLTAQTNLTAGDQTPFLGEVRLFAGNLAPGGWAVADGLVLPISAYPELFDVLGTTYGGDGTTTFALPDLRGRAVVGEGQGNGLDNRLVGQAGGIENLTLTVGQLPAHTHSLTEGVTGSTGAGQAFDNLQPFLSLQTIITFDSENPYGEIRLFAGTLQTGLGAEGQLLSRNVESELYATIGQTYGGNFFNLFNLPDLRGRVAVGKGGSSGTGNHPAGQAYGIEDGVLAVGQLPSHTHTTTTSPTGATGSGLPFDNTQPSLSMTYAIATQGTIPNPGTIAASSDPYIGQISLFASPALLPDGWLSAEGQSRTAAGSSLLFNVLGTAYGGDGVNFNLPDLRGRFPIGQGPAPDSINRIRGEKFGSESVVLTVGQLPPHDHTVPQTPIVTLNLPNSAVSEASGNLAFTFTRSGNTTGALSVNFAVTGTAIGFTDYSVVGSAAFNGSAGTVTFAPGSATAVVNAIAVSDRLVEGNETVAFQIVGGSGFITGTTNSVTGVILEDDTASVGFASATSTFLEGSGTQNIGVTLTISAVGTVGQAQLTRALTVSVANLGTGSAQFNADYTINSPQTFSWAVGEGASTKFATATVLADTTPEGDETVRLLLTRTVGDVPLIAPTEHTLTIQDDDVDLKVTKLTTPTSVIAGSGTNNLTFVVTVQNVGPSNATGVSLREALSLPAGVTVVSATPSIGTVSGAAPTYTWNFNIGAGAAATFTVVMTVSSATQHQSLVTGTATLLGAGQGLVNTADDAASTSVNVTRQVDLRVTKTGVTTVTAGSGPGNVVYTVLVANVGLSDATGVTITETTNFPTTVTLDAFSISIGTFSGAAGTGTWVIGNLAKGASATLSMTFTVGQNVTAGADLISDTATLTEVNEPIVNTGDDEATLKTSIVRQVDLKVSVTGPTLVLAGSGANNVVYTVTVTNTGPSTANGVQLSETTTLQTGVTVDSFTATGGTFTPNSANAKGTGTWAVGTLAPGASVTLTFQLTVTKTARGGTGVVSHTSQVSAVAETALIPEDDTAKVTTTVQRAPTFASPPAVRFFVGRLQTFTVSTIGFPAPTLSLVGRLPAGLTFRNNGNGTATIRGIPRQGTGRGVGGRRYVLQIRASNGIGPVILQTLVITVRTPGVVRIWD